MASIAINLSVAATMVKVAGFGQAGLAFTTSAVALFGFVVQFVMLRNRIGGIHGRALVAQVGRIVLASAAMAIVVGGASYFMRGWLGVAQSARMADVAVSLPLGLTVFYFAAKALGLSELDMVLRSFLGPVRRRLKKV
jgi:peptidoglycan biosynthesis protein MviN/MurJ (putative lipid II flippase)